jgi:hypothetical protein
MRIPNGVTACGPDGQLSHLPAEDVAVLQEFAAFLTDWPKTDLVPCDVVPEWHPEDDCPTPYICTPQGDPK